MNIFIYGSDAFENDINKVLDHSNIKLRLTDNDSLQVIATLIELRTAIENHPKDIFLIDDAKIFRKNALNKKIKFLKPSDAIEEEFLKEHGIGDIRINSLEELPSHIIQKIESLYDSSEEDDYYDSNDSDIQESIIDIVDEAYNDDEQANLQNSGNDDKIDLDDELSSLLSSNNYDEDEEGDFPSNEINEEDNESFDDISEEDEIQTNEIQGEDMADEFSELDALNENDILAALDGLDDMEIDNTVDASSKPVQQSAQDTASNSINLNGSNANDIMALITQLLNNKTLEITVKVKA